jgi:hypothetical protein
MAGSSIRNDFVPIGSLIGMMSCLMAEIDHEFGVISCLGGQIKKGFGETFGLIGRILDFDFDMEMDFRTSRYDTFRTTDMQFQERLARGRIG